MNATPNAADAANFRCVICGAAHVALGAVSVTYGDRRSTLCPPCTTRAAIDRRVRAQAEICTAAGVSLPEASALFKHIGMAPPTTPADVAAVFERLAAMAGTKGSAR